MNRLLQLFYGEEACDLDTTPLRRFFDGFDWASFGVAKTYVMFITGRCGSTLLSGLLKSTDLCGRPEEFFNETVVPYYRAEAGPRDLTGYFAHVVSRYASNACFGFQIDPLRLEALAEIADLKAMMGEGCRYFVMTRRDIVSQAYSFAHAKRSGHWQTWRRREEAERAAAPDTALSDLDLWNEILLILEGERLFREFLASRAIAAYALDYESLLADRIGVVSQCLLHLGFDPGAIVSSVSGLREQTEKIEYEGKLKTIASFRGRYREILSLIHAKRDAITVADIKAALRPRG